MLKQMKLVGIVNVTPDSFSDGGQWLEPKDAVTQAQQLLADGAAVLDIGAESTRPNAKAVSAEAEWQRLEPVLSALLPVADDARAEVSVDTRHADTARQALALGVDWINDVTGLGDAAMQQVVRDFPQSRWVVMHSLTVPVDPAVTLPIDVDPVVAVREWAEERLAQLEDVGIERERILLDPGIGFGKTAEQSLQLIQGIRQLAALGCPLYVGHSRKSFLSLFTDAPAEERDVESAAVSLWLMQQGVAYVRVHDVAMHARMMKVAGAVCE